MLEASGVGAVVRRGRGPVWERAVSLAADGCYPGGLGGNRESLGGRATADGTNSEDLLPLYDPQTSGGLLIAVEEARAGGLTRALHDRGETAEVVGEVVEGSGGRVSIKPRSSPEQASLSLPICSGSGLGSGREGPTAGGW